MVEDESLFSKYDLRKIIENKREKMAHELDAMVDSHLLNADLNELKLYASEKYKIHLPVLGDPEIDEGRTKTQASRYGYSGYRDYGREPTVEVDAHRYTLEIPFEGDKDLFFTQGSQFTLSPPRGTVRAGILSMTLIEREPDPSQLNQKFERFVSDINKHLEWLKSDIEIWNSKISQEIEDIVLYRKERAEKLGTVSSGLKFSLKQRTDSSSTYSAPVSKLKKLTPQMPPAKPGSPPEPVLTDEMYRAIIDTLKQMSEVMERSPHAYATMDEETLRFQFLVPLNANFGRVQKL